MGKAVIDCNRAVPQRPLEGHHGRGAKAAERRHPIRLVDEALPRGAERLRRCRRQRGAGRGERIERREGGCDRMVGRYRQFRRAYRLQQPGQFLRFVPEFPANLGHSGRQAFRFEWRDQIPQPRPQIGGAEPLVIGQGRKIAEESMKTAQPARLDCRHALSGAAPLGRDLVIEEGEARIGELQQSQTQEAGDLDRAMRVLDARQRRGLARHHPPREMLEARERQIGQHKPVRTQLLQEADFLDLRFEASNRLARRHGAEPIETADPAVLDWRQQARQPRLLGRARQPRQWF